MRKTENNKVKKNYKGRKERSHKSIKMMSDKQLR